MPFKHKPRWDDVEVFLCAVRAAVLSVNQVIGERPTIYTDSIGKQVFSELNMECDIVVIHDGLYQDGDPDDFAISKLYTYQHLAVPFVHFDLDIIFETDFSDLFVNTDLDVFGFCSESVTESNRLIDHEGDFLYLSEEAKNQWRPVGPFYNRNQDDVHALNCCVIYFNNQQFLDKYIDSSLACYTNNSHIPRSVRSNWDVVAEQQLLTNLLLDHNVKWGQLVNHWPVLFADIEGIINTFSDIVLKRSSKNKMFLMRKYYNSDVSSAAQLLKQLFKQ